MRILQAKKSRRIEVAYFCCDGDDSIRLFRIFAIFVSNCSCPHKVGDIFKDSQDYSEEEVKWMLMGQK